MSYRPITLKCKCGGKLQSMWLLPSDQSKLIEQFHEAHAVCRTSTSPTITTIAATWAATKAEYDAMVERLHYKRDYPPQEWETLPFEVNA